MKSDDINKHVKLPPGEQLPSGMEINIPPGAQTLAKFAKTYVGSLLISALSPLTGTPVSPEKVRSFAKMADAGITAYKNLEKNMENEPKDEENKSSSTPTPAPSPFNKKPSPK